MDIAQKILSKHQEETLLSILEKRFKTHINRHKDIRWEDVEKKLRNNPEKFWSISEMEKTGGEPDVIGYDKNSGELIFCDCSEESPKGRRSLCYDRRAWESRKENKPAGNALDMAKSMGIDILTEQEYRELQKLGSFDQKTSSWIKTPDRIRELGGALFCDRRYDTVFVYHNSAESYYASRGFRGIVRIK
ncbi:MAG: DUF4256 domain-containing protein [Bacteroidales bacterium]|nr:DUF4256 domain-containing protein [Bacteroidales bacterium]